LVTSLLMSDEQTIQLLAEALDKERSVALAAPELTPVAVLAELVSAEELQTIQAVVVAL
jgi:hypothetical protein